MKFFTNWIESLVRGCVRECLFDSADARQLLQNTVAWEVEKSLRSVCRDPAAIANSLSDPQLKEIAKSLVDDVTYRIDLDDVAERLAEKVDIDTSEIARNVTRNVDMDDIVSRVVDEIDMGQVCEACAERIAVDSDDVVERAAELAKDDIDVDAVIEKVADSIDWEADVLDYESLARALLKCFAKSIVKS